MMKTRGYYNGFGGAFIPEILAATFEELDEAFQAIKNDPGFWEEYSALMSSYSCRPTPITYAENLTRHFGGPRIFVKREDLNHTGAHKANNVIGQGLLTRRMGKTRVIAETGAGQHGVATATMAAKFGFECTIYMGEVDVQRQRPNVFWMERLGAKVVAVKDGSRILKDAINEAFRDWVSHMDTTHYVLGTACGPHPFPEMVMYFQSIIGKEAREQMLRIAGRLPDRIYACVGGGSNALGIFSGFWDDPVTLVGVRAGGEGLAPAGMPCGWPQRMQALVSLRDIKLFSFRMTMARCGRPIVWRRVSITSVSHRFWRIAPERAGSGLNPRQTGR